MLKLYIFTNCRDEQVIWDCSHMRPLLSGLLKARVINLPVWKVIDTPSPPPHLTCEWRKAMTFDLTAAREKNQPDMIAAQMRGETTDGVTPHLTVIAELFTPLDLFQGNQQIMCSQGRCPEPPLISGKCLDLFFFHFISSSFNYQQIKQIKCCLAEHRQVSMLITGEYLGEQKYHSI